MKKEMLSSKQVINMMINFMLGSSVIMGGKTIAKQDAWLTILIGSLFMIPLIFIYGKLIRLYPGKNVFEMLFECFGKIGGSIITFIFSIYSIHLGAMVMRNFTEFIQSVSLQETPQFAFAIMIGILCLWSAKAGIEILGRGAVLVLPIIAAIIIGTTFMLINQMDLSYIKPMFNASFDKIMLGSFSHLSYPFGETVLFLAVLPCLDTKANPYKVYGIGISIASVLLTIAMIRNILVLGMPTLEPIYYPSYSAVGMINIRDFISRIEVLVAGNFIISGLMKITVCLYVGCKGFARLFNLSDYKVLVAPITFLMIALSEWTYSSIMEMFAYIQPYAVYAPIFQILIPLVLLIVTLIKNRKTSKKVTTNKLKTQLEV